VLRQKIQGAIAWFMCLLVLYLLSRQTYDSMRIFFKWLNRINYVFIILSVFLFVILMIDPMLMELFIQASKVESDFGLSTGSIGLLGSVDAEVSFGSLVMPRSSAHLSQSSLIPAYIMFPFSIGLILGVVKRKGFLLTLFFLLLSFGGNVYFATGNIVKKVLHT
jgi:hypothetical protein